MIYIYAGSCPHLGEGGWCCCRLRGRLGQPIDGLFFVDDAPGNVTAARDAGMDAVQFTDAAALRDQLRSRGLLD